MEPAEILAVTRRMIIEHACGDPDKWFYANRYVFARLQQDELKTKRTVKKDLLARRVDCHRCMRGFDTAKGVHLHRINGAKGYSTANCVLMHRECHQELHAQNPPQRIKQDRSDGVRADTEPVLCKWSKRYEGRSFVYWWDMSPQLAQRLGSYEAIEFVRKDTRERCSVSPQEIAPFLTEKRRTSRGKGNWGVRELVQRPDELAFEPPTSSDDWLYLSVVWLSPSED